MKSILTLSTLLLLSSNLLAAETNRYHVSPVSGTSDILIGDVLEVKDANRRSLVEINIKIKSKTGPKRIALQVLERSTSGVKSLNTLILNASNSRVQKSENDVWTVKSRLRIPSPPDDQTFYKLYIDAKNSLLTQSFKMKKVRTTQRTALFSTSDSNRKQESCTCRGGPGMYPYQCAPVKTTCHGGPGLYPYTCYVCPQ